MIKVQTFTFNLVSQTYGIYYLEGREMVTDVCAFLFFCFVTGDLEPLKMQAFVLKEGVEYKIKISFKVRDLL